MMLGTAVKSDDMEAIVLDNEQNKGMWKSSEPKENLNNSYLCLKGWGSKFRTVKFQNGKWNYGNMKFDKIANGAKYRIDEQFQNLLIFGILIICHIQKKI